MTPQRSASWLSVHVSVQKFLLVAVMMMCHVSLSNAFVPHSRLLQLHRTPQLEQNHKKTLDLKKVQRTVLNAGYGRIDIAAVKPKTRPYHLVLVESPSKCSTISKILNKYVKDNNLDFDYVVVATMGHVRNLPRSGKNQTVVGVDVHNQYQPTYEILPGKEGLVKDLQSLAKDAQQIVLATDEDREGEAIAWHTSEILPPELPRVRVTFTEITPSAILHSIQHPREIDMDLVDAQETRRVLDRIAGYTLSPLLWKKIAPGLSAGRVQSVGMALVVQRERERLKHVPVAYWDLKAAFDGNVTAILVQLNGQDIAKGGDFDNTGHLVAKKKLHMEEQLANDVLQSMAGGEVNSWLQDPNKSTWTVTSVKSRERSNKPPVPFITSTLQQESVRRLGMSVSQAMSCAQKLYEAGFISYMRTDSTHMSNDAQSATTDAVTSQFGEPFLVPPKEDKKKSKNAQESHEAIRPAIQASGGFYESRDLVEKVSEAELQLYELIFNRTLASRMTPQVLNSTSMEIEGVSVDGQTTVLFRLSGSVIVNPGFTLAYGGKSSDASLLPPWQEGMELNCEDLSSVGHETKPPARYTEASFVKELETLGVGRPSTYAGTVQILRDRAYVGTPVRADGSKGKGREKERKGTSIIAGRAAGGSEFTDGGRGPLVPSLSAFVVCSLLEKHLSSYVDPTFTAGMEDTLDVIAQGDEGADRIAYLDEFYGGEEGLAATVKRVDETIESDEARKAQLPGLLTSSDNSDESISLMIGPWGPYIQKTDAHTNEKLTTAQLPAGMASDLSTITPQSLATLLESREKNGVVLGHHPTDGREIRLKVGRYGAYLQWGSEGADDTTNHSLPRHMGNMRNLDFSSEDGETSLDSMIGLSFDDAVKYVGLPREVCVMKELPVIAAIGPYGPYLKYNNTFASLRKSDSDVLTIEEKEANIIVTERIIEKKAGTFKYAQTVSCFVFATTPHSNFQQVCKMLLLNLVRWRVAQLESRMVVLGCISTGKRSTRRCRWNTRKILSLSHWTRHGRLFRQNNLRQEEAKERRSRKQPLLKSNYHLLRKGQCRPISSFVTRNVRLCLRRQIHWEKRRKNLRDCGR